MMQSVFQIQSSGRRLQSIQLLRGERVGGAEISAKATVRCSRHGPSLGYVVCVHVLHGAALALVRHPRTDDAGEILCADCIDLRAVELAKLDVVCALCAADNLWIPSA